MSAGDRALRALRELDDRSGGRRVAWTETWAGERRRWAEAAAAIPGVTVATDAAGNQWATLPGREPGTVVAGSHLDCVPGGGWLDGCLGVMAAEAPRSADRLRARGVDVIQIPYGEIHKNGGGVHCSTMELVRDRAG